MELTFTSWTKNGLLLSHVCCTKPQMKSSQRKEPSTTHKVDLTVLHTEPRAPTRQALYQLSCIPSPVKLLEAKKNMSTPGRCWHLAYWESKLIDSFPLKPQRPHSIKRSYRQHACPPGVKEKLRYSETKEIKRLSQQTHWEGRKATWEQAVPSPRHSASTPLTSPEPLGLPPKLTKHSSSISFLQRGPRTSRPQLNDSPALSKFYWVLEKSIRAAILNSYTPWRWLCILTCLFFSFH